MTSSPGRFCFSPNTRTRVLLANNDYGEGAGFHLAAALTWSWWLKFSDWKKDLVGLQIQAHSTCRLFSRNIFYDAVLVGRIFVNDRKVPVAARRKEKIRCGIKCRG